MEKINPIILSIGSNLGDKYSNLKQAIEKIEKSIGCVLSVSSIYETEPLGFQSEDNFYNICVEIESDLKPLDLLYATQNIELEIGRLKKSGDFYESRVIDIDIILYKAEQIDLNDLKVPHTKFLYRKFVLIPLLEICPDILNPTDGQAISKFLHKCPDNSLVKKISHVI